MEIRNNINTQDANAINICVANKAGYIHTEAFRDLAERIEAESHRKGKLVTITKSIEREADLNIVLGGHIDAEYFLGFRKHRLTIINLERLEWIGNHQNGSKYLELLSKNHYLDFCSQNLKYAEKNGLRQPDYLYRPWHEPKWFRTIEEAEKVWDACFIGSMTPRRETICRELQKRGVNLKISANSYSSERDEILSRSKYIINMHAYEDSNSAELLRLNYYASNKLRCVSETCDFEKGEQRISDALTQLPYEEFAEGLYNLICTETRESYDEERNKFYQAVKEIENCARKTCAVNQTKPTILNLNCGQEWREDALNVNCNKGQYEDLALELSVEWKAIKKIQTTKRHGTFYLAENSFDAIIMNGLLETTHNPVLLLENVARLMKPGGWLLIKSSHQDGLDAWANPKAKRAINEEFIARLQKQEFFPNLRDTLLQIKWIELLRGANNNKVDINYTPRTESIEAVCVKSIKEPNKSKVQGFLDRSIEEQKILGITSSREQLHRKTYLMNDVRQPPKATRIKPCVSLLTPTSGDRFRFLQLTWKWINQQDYPKDLIEWIILTDTNEEADYLRSQSKKIEKYLDLTIKISATNKKEYIGMKRNICNRMAEGEILINFDDDDYYFPNRISHAVEMLANEENTTYEIAGSHALPIYFSQDKSLWISKPGENLACAGSFAYKKTLLSKTWYSANAQRGEEISFTNEYKIPILNLDPFSTMVCISHKNNTFDKNRLREKFGGGEIKNTIINGKRYKGSKEFYCLSEGDKGTSPNEWEEAYENVCSDVTPEVNDEQKVCVFEIKKDAERGIAGLAMKLHKKFIGE